jgi:hypothetical protein
LNDVPSGLPDIIKDERTIGMHSAHSVMRNSILRRYESQL